MRNSTTRGTARWRSRRRKREEDLEEKEEQQDKEEEDAKEEEDEQNDKEVKEVWKDKEEEEEEQKGAECQESDFSIFQSFYTFLWDSDLLTFHGERGDSAVVQGLADVLSGVLGGEPVDGQAALHPVGPHREPPAWHHLHAIPQPLDVGLGPAHLAAQGDHAVSVRHRVPQRRQELDPHSWGGEGFRVRQSQRRERPEGLDCVRCLMAFRIPRSNSCGMLSYQCTDTGLVFVLVLVCVI